MKNLKTFNYTPEQVQFLLSYSPGRKVKEITSEYNCTFGTSANDDAIRSFLERHEILYQKRARLPNINYTPKQIQFLREFSPSHIVKEIVDGFNERFAMGLSDAVIRDYLEKQGIAFKRVCKEPKIRHDYTIEQLQFLKEVSSGRTTAEITALFNETFGIKVTTNSIRHMVKTNQMEFDKRTTTRFSQEQKQFLLDHYSSTHSTEVADLFNKTFGTNQSRKSIVAMASILGVRSGFRKTLVFGRPIGTEVIESHGYIKVRVPRSEAPGVNPYKFKQVYVWEKAHGPVPPGMKLTFKDGNRGNCDQENLVLVSNSELLHLTKNDYRQMPAELKPSVFALSKLQAKMTERLKIAKRR